MKALLICWIVVPLTQCLEQFINVDLGESTKFTSDLDNYPVVRVEGKDDDNPRDFCSFGTPSFQPHLSKTVKTNETDPFLLHDEAKMFNFNDTNFAIWRNSTDKHIWSILLRNFAISREEIPVFACSWNVLGDLEPVKGEHYSVVPVIREPFREFLKEDMILVNKGNPQDETPRNYMVKFRVVKSSGCIDPKTIISFQQFKCDLGSHIFLKSQIIAYMHEKFLKFDFVDNNGTIVEKYKYDPQALGLNLKDLFYLNDDSSVLVIDHRFDADQLYLSDFANFMQPEKVRTMFSCPNMSFFATSKSHLVVLCTQTAYQDIYFLTGKSFLEYTFQKARVSTTFPIKQVEQLDRVIMVGNSNAEIYFIFKDYLNQTSYFNYSIFQPEVKGFIYTNYTTTDVQTMSAIISFDAGDSRVVTTSEFGFATLDIGTNMVCNLPDKTMTLKFEVDTLLNTTYRLTLSRHSTSPEQSLSTLVKNIMITATIVLAMLLILGSFWLMSKKSKEEDNALEEFKLDYIKYSNKRNLNDSSSLINHEIS